MAFDLVKLHPNERIDLPDFNHIVGETPTQLMTEVHNQFHSVNQSWVLDGFEMTGVGTASLTITLGRAILGVRDEGVIRYGMITATGDASKTISIGTFTEGASYNVYIRFQFVDGDEQSRVHWDESTQTQIARSVTTRRKAAWAPVAELTTAGSPGSEWLLIGTFTKTGGAVASLIDKRPFFFEGAVNDTYASGWGSGTDRNADRAQYGTKDLQSQLAALRQCVEDIKGTGLRRWWDPDIGGLTVGFDGTAREDTVYVGNTNVYLSSNGPISGVGELNLGGPSFHLYAGAVGIYASGILAAQTEFRLVSNSVSITEDTLQFNSPTYITRFGSTLMYYSDVQHQFYTNNNNRFEVNDDGISTSHDALFTSNRGLVWGSIATPDNRMLANGSYFRFETDETQILDLEDLGPAGGLTSLKFIGRTGFTDSGIFEFDRSNDLGKFILSVEADPVFTAQRDDTGVATDYTYTLGNLTTITTKNTLVNDPFEITHDGKVFGIQESTAPAGDSEFQFRVATAADGVAIVPDSTSSGSHKIRCHGDLTIESLTTAKDVKLVGGSSGSVVLEGSSTTNGALSVKHTGGGAGIDTMLLEAPWYPGTTYTGDWIQFRTPVGYYAAIISNGGPTVQFTATSDERMKTDIRRTRVDGLSVVEQVAPIEFTWDEGPTEGTFQPIGLSAQELQRQFPECVFENRKRLNLRTEYLTFVLWDAVHRLAAQVRTLQKATPRLT